jgi:hypothetical protein
MSITAAPGPGLAAASDPHADLPELRRKLDQLHTALDNYAVRQGLVA